MRRRYIRPGPDENPRTGSLYRALFGAVVRAYGLLPGGRGRSGPVERGGRRRSERHSGSSRCGDPGRLDHCVGAVFGDSATLRGLGPGSVREIPDPRARGPSRALRTGQVGRDWTVAVESGAEMQAEVARQATEGVDLIKLYSGVPPELVGVTVDEASRYGVPVALHAGETLWTEAVDLGVAMLVHSGHGTPMDEIVSLDDPAGASGPDWYAAHADAPAGPGFQRLVQSLVRQGVTVVPTLAIAQVTGLRGDAKHLSAFETHLAPEADLPGWWGEG